MCIYDFYAVISFQKKSLAQEYLIKNICYPLKKNKVEVDVEEKLPMMIVPT